MAVELATAYVSLVPSFKGGGRAIAKELGPSAESAGTDAGKKMGQKMGSGMTSSLKGIGAAIGGTVVANKAFDFLGDATGKATNFAETVSKVRAVFGPASAGLEAWGKDAAKTMGLSMQQALDLAGSFGNMFGQLGIGRTQAAQMSTAMGGLASDLASFHNADISDVIDAQQAAFRGEYDSIQRFIPTISAATVEQEALRESGKKSAKDLSATDKALATQALLMKGAGKATGDFARTSDGLANKQRIQAAEMDNLKVKIGNGLLPIVSKITSGFIAFTGWIDKNRAVVGPLAVVLGGALVAALTATAVAAVQAAIASNSLLLPYIAVGAAVAGLAILVIKNWSTIKHAIGAAVDFVTGLITGLIDTFKKIPGWIAGALSKVADIITAPYRAAFNAIATLWNKTIGKLHVHIPSIHLGPFKTPGVDFSVPNIPTFHQGGVVPGRPGQDVFARLKAGETVIPAGAPQKGVEIHNHWNGTQLDEATVVEIMNRTTAWRLMTLYGSR